MKNIVNPTRRCSGALVVGAIFFILCMTCGYVAFAYGGRSGAEVIYKSADPSQYALRHITLADDEYQTTFQVADEKAFHDYLSGLTLSELTGNYSFTESEKKFTYILDTPDGALGIILYDNALKLSPLYEENPTASYYYITEGVDWDYLSTVILALPAVNIHLSKNGDAYGKDISARLDMLWEPGDGQRSLVYASEHPRSEKHGIFGYDPYEAVFSFSHELAAPCSVLIENWDRTNRYTVTQIDMAHPFVLELPAYPAHYTVYASFHSPNGEIYEAEFRFEIGNVDSV